MGPVELLVFTFPAGAEAEDALARLHSLKKAGELALINAAVVRKDETGRLHIKDPGDLDRGQGALFGAVTGALLGLLAGPAGAVIGAIAGATTGGVAAGKLDMGIPDDALRLLGTNLASGGATLVVVLEQSHVARATAAMDDFTVTLLHQPLAPDWVEQFEVGEG